VVCYFGCVEVIPAGLEVSTWGLERRGRKGSLFFCAQFGGFEVAWFQRWIGRHFENLGESLGVWEFFNIYPTLQSSWSECLLKLTFLPDSIARFASGVIIHMYNSGEACKLYRQSKDSYVLKVSHYYTRVKCSEE
jgi:hypothetical protein